MSLSSPTMYQVIYTQRKDRNLHQARVTADGALAAKAAFYYDMNRRGLLRMDIKIISLFIEGTLEADQAIVAAQSLQDTVDAKEARKRASLRSL